MPSIRDIWNTQGYPTNLDPRTGNSFAAPYGGPQGLLGQSQSIAGTPQNWWENDMFNIPQFAPRNPITGLPEEQGPVAPIGPSRPSRPSVAYGEGETGEEEVEDTPEDFGPAPASAGLGEYGTTNQGINTWDDFVDYSKALGRGIASPTLAGFNTATPYGIPGVWDDFTSSLGYGGPGTDNNTSPSIDPDFGYEDISATDASNYDEGFGFDTNQGLGYDFDEEGFGGEVGGNESFDGGTPSGSDTNNAGEEQGGQAAGEGPGGESGEGEDSCVISTALNNTGAWTDSEKRRAVLWCRDTHHDGSLRGRVWVRGYHGWGKVIARLTRRSTAFRWLVKRCSTAFVGQVTGDNPSVLGFVIRWGWATPLSYVIGAFRRDD